jgi:membrane carboxypeptidase/penicillin-binding protein
MRNVGGIRVTGGSYPAATWGAYMAEAMKGQPVLKFTEPDLKSFGKPSAVKTSKAAGGGTPRVAPTTAPVVTPPAGETG